VPTLSVVMPVHNAAPFLASSIESILHQTYRDFEFVILDDASTDGSAEILREWARRDTRIRLIESRTRLGITGSANCVVWEARTATCARMDADDVSRPDRLAAQWAVLEARPEAVLVGTLWQGIDDRGRVIRPRDRWRLLHPNGFAPFPHGSIMFRREVFLDTGGYRAECELWEDFDLYLRMGKRGHVLVLPEALYRYRFHAGSTTLVADDDRLATAIGLMHRCISHRRANGDHAECPTGLAGELPVRGAVSPSALMYLGLQAVWAGQSPAILRRLRRLERHQPIGPVLKLLALGVWAACSPSSLRLLLAALVWSRDRMAARRLPDGVAVPWRN
jgi:glycosyltransferase involved in cell wall biosynthesis